VHRDVRPESGRSADVAVGLVVTATRLSAGAVRTLTLPARLLARSFLLEPVVRSATDELASSGRQAEARARRRAETAAAELLAAPETARTLDRALAGPLPAALDDEAIERLARRLLDSPAFERVVRDAAESRVVHDLVDDAVRSDELQRAVEEVLSGAGVRNALRRETRTLRDEVAERVRAAAVRLDDRLERPAHRALRVGERGGTLAVGAPRYAGLAGRGVGFTADAAVTHLALLVVGSLVGLLGWLLGVDAPAWLLGALAGAGWALFVGGYFAFFWTVAGQTPGMRLVALRVVGPTGGPPSAGRSLLRFAGLMLAIAPLGAGFIPVLFDSRRRALQDFVARTVVVYDPWADVRSPTETSGGA
jgi:uncharacterized RDD family membrane protein YckC